MSLEIVAPHVIAALYYANAIVWAFVALSFIPIYLDARKSGATERQSFSGAILLSAVGHVMLALYWVEINTAWSGTWHSVVVAVYSALFLFSGLRHIRTATLGKPVGKWLWRVVGAVAAMVAGVRVWFWG